MKRNDRIVAITLAYILVILIYLIGGSITGYLSGTMYCEEGECKPFCRADTDCVPDNEVCCQNMDFGVCERVAACGKPYSFQPEGEWTIELEDSQPRLERPAPPKGRFCIFTVLLIIVIIVGILYYLSKKKSKRVATKKGMGKMTSKKKGIRGKRKNIT